MSAVTVEERGELSIGTSHLCLDHDLHIEVDVEACFPTTSEYWLDCFGSCGPFAEILISDLPQHELAVPE